MQAATMYADAIRLGEHLGWLALPLYDREGRLVPPGPYSDLVDKRYSLELIERLWDGHDDADGLGVVWPADVIEAEADSDAGTEWLRNRGLPRTPSFSSRRGPHYLFRGDATGLNAAPAPGVEVLSRASGKRLLVIPPSGGKTWWPSLSPFDCALAPLPSSLRAAARVNGNGHRKQRVHIELGPDLPPGEAHNRMLSIVGRLANVLPTDELATTAKALNAGRLPEAELAAIVSDVASRTRDVERYFDRHEGFRPAILAGEIDDAYHVRVGAGQHLYRYRDGVYLDDGPQFVGSIVRRVLGDKFRPRHAEEVVKTLATGLQQIPETPPADLLNVVNGMLDWRTGELRPHDPSYLSVTQVPVAWNPAATCPAIDQFLADVLPEDAQQLAREMFGYALLPTAPLRKAFMFLGPGANGKSTTISLMRALLGLQSVSAVPLQAFAEDRFATATVFGKLANLCGDLDSRALRRSDTFKTLVGGTDAVFAQRKYGHPFSFVPYATLVFSANEAPASSDQTDAYFDRWVVLPFARRFEGSDADPHLLGKLIQPDELEGLLVQAVAGLMDLMERGRFELPPSVEAANAEYRQRVDTVATFLDEACDVAPQNQTARGRLYEAYREWCARNGRMPVGQQAFSPRVRQLLHREIEAGAVEEGKTHTGRVWRGIALREVR